MFCVAEICDDCEGISRFWADKSRFRDPDEYSLANYSRCAQSSPTVRFFKVSVSDLDPWMVQYGLGTQTFWSLLHQQTANQVFCLLRNLLPLVVRETETSCEWKFKLNF